MAAYGQKRAGRCRERFRSPLGIIPESPAERGLDNMVALDAPEKGSLLHFSEYDGGSKHIMVFFLFSHFSLIGSCGNCKVPHVRRHLANLQPALSLKISNANGKYALAYVL